MTISKHGQFFLRHTVDDTPVDVAMTKKKMVNCFIYILRKKKDIIKARKKVCAFSK